VCKYLNWGRKGDRARFFSAVPGDRTRSNGHKHGRFPLSIQKHLFTVRVTEHWNCLPREAVESPPLELSGHGPGQLAVGDPAWATGLDTTAREVPASLSQPVILWRGHPNASCREMGCEVWSWGRRCCLLAVAGQQDVSPCTVTRGKMKPPLAGWVLALIWFHQPTHVLSSL